MRGNNIWISILVLAIVLPMTFAITPVFAPSTTLNAPTIADPLKAPGSTVTVYIGIDDITNLHHFDFKMSYNPAILNCYAYTPIGASPNFMTTNTSLPHGFDNTLGEVWFSGVRYRAGGFTTDLLLPFLSMKFDVVGRGTSAFTMHDIVFTDINGNSITPIVLTNGSFDNNFQGELIAPKFQNATLIAGDIFSIDISVDDVTKLWGYQMTLGYDNNVMTAFDWAPLGVFTQYGPSEVGDGYITFSANSYYGDPTGLSTSTPVAIATIYFQLNQEGWSTLDINSEKLANVYGDAQTLEVFDGAFTSVYAADLKSKGAWAEHSIFFELFEPDQYDTLFARVATTSTGAPLNVKVVFSVYDKRKGILLGTIETATVTMPENSEQVLSTDFDTEAWGTGWYLVWITAQVHYDVNGDGVMDFAGSKMKSFWIFVIPWPWW